MLPEENLKSAIHSEFPGELGIKRTPILGLTFDEPEDHMAF